MLPVQLRLIRGLLRLFFKLLYHPMAWTYDWVADIVSLGKWKTWIYSTLPYLDAERILELGHGPGHLQEMLLQRSQRSIGVDASPQMGRLASRRLKRKGYQPDLIHGKAQQLPFAEGSFQRVVATFPSEYISDPQTLIEIRRVLTTGGEAIILLLAWITGKGLYHRAANWLFRITGQSFQWEDRYLDPIRQKGFEAHTELIQLEDSNLLIIILKKISG